jgi:hypothetical protein
MLYLALQVRLPGGGGPCGNLGVGLGRPLRRRQRRPGAADGASGAHAEPGIDAGGVERVAAPGQRAHRLSVLHGAQAHRALRRPVALRLEPEHRRGRQRRLVDALAAGPLPLRAAAASPVHAVAAAPPHVQVVEVQDDPVQRQAHSRERAHQLQRRAGAAAPARRRRRRRAGRLPLRGHAAGPSSARDATPPSPRKSEWKAKPRGARFLGELAAVLVLLLVDENNNVIWVRNIMVGPWNGLVVWNGRELIEEAGVWIMRTIREMIQ